MLTYWEILTAIQSDIPIYDSYAKLWGEKLSNAYTTTTYTGTLPATLTGTKAGYLHRYNVFGNVGENLYDYRKIVPGYTYDSTNGQMILNPDVANRRKYAAIPLIKVEPGATYLRTYNLAPWGNYINLYDENKNFLNQIAPGSGIPVTVPSNCGFVSFVFQIDKMNVEKYMFTKGSTPPESYIPYEGCGERTENGYKLPLLSGSTPVDIYIGDDTLSTEEYVDSGTGKIYRMVSGVLTPTEPPVPFPQIPTSADSTTISWAGEGLAPSQVEFIYKAKR